MRTGVKLSELRKELQIEAGFSTQNGGAGQTTERLNHLLNRLERTLFVEHEWPALTTEEEVAVAADAQYVNLPTTINFTQINSVQVSYGTVWLPVTLGIGATERSQYSTTQRANPIRRWEIVAPGNVEFEVWPIGNVAQTLRFEGNKSPGGMVDDTDSCTIDGDVLVLSAAAEILGRDRKEDAALKLGMAKTLIEKIMVKEGSAKRESINLGRGKRTMGLRPGIDYIPPGAGY